MGDGLHILLLGPVSVRKAGSTAAVRSRPQRIVLACLALEANRVVPMRTLVDALWPEDPPPNAAGNLHSYVSKLRRLVGPDRIPGEHGGYRLDVDRDAVDAVRVEQLAGAAERLDAPERAALLDEALSLWKGEPLADLDDVDALMPDRTRLAALRRQLDVQRMTALVEAGDASGVLPEVRQSAASNPHDESIVALLAQSLCATGRTAEALRVIADFRRRIIEDTGLEPGPRLTRLEKRILSDTPEPGDNAPRRGTSMQEAGQAAPATAEWPRYATPLHGRDAELASVDELVGSQRIVTVTGTGGIGKTRLACALADRRSSTGQAVHFMALATLSPDDDLAARLAAALGLRVQPGQDPVRAVTERVGIGGQLLVLDNCEHVLDAVRSLVERLLAERSDLTVLATSRAPLRLPAEYVVHLAALDRDDGAGLELFLERAHRVQPSLSVANADMEAVRTVVRGLGGLPLALELAAGRLASMTLGDLADRIDDLDLLTGGGPSARHRTLRTAIDWSYRLLPEPERRLLRTLSLFPAGVDLVTVEELAPDLQLPGSGTPEAVALADASLVDADLGRSVRYTLLDPVRTFAAERLEDAGERASARSLRAQWARRVAAWIQDVSSSPTEAAADARLRSELANLRATHRAALQGGDLDTAISISAALMRPATERDLPEVWSWALALAAHPALPEHPRCTDALGAGANAAWLTGDLEGGERLAADGLRRDPDSVACLQALASVRLFLGDPVAAHRLWMAASRHDGAYLPQAALAAVYQGDDELTRRRLAEADAWASDLGSPTEIALCRYASGEQLGPHMAAVGHYEQAISLASGAGATFVASISRVGLASTLAANGHHRRAIQEFDTVIRYWRRTGNWTQQWTTLRNVADLVNALGRQSTARRIRAAAAKAPAAAAPRPGTNIADLDVADTHPALTPEPITALVLSELADLRRQAEIDDG